MHPRILRLLRGEVTMLRIDGYIEQDAGLSLRQPYLSTLGQETAGTLGIGLYAFLCDLGR